jgi:hypothetical protein
MSMLRVGIQQLPQVVSIRSDRSLTRSFASDETSGYASDEHIRIESSGIISQSIGDGWRFGRA